LGKLKTQERRPIYSFTKLLNYQMNKRIGNEGRAKPVNQSTPAKGEKHWQDIKVQFAAFAVAKA
jgi:hypothetical protein